ncbi:MAG: hypothetical protein P4L83_17950 [Nevskia sp.]|nr:hypothetical protein [Nevskia sp.]
MKLISICGVVAAAAACLSPVKALASCTATGFMRDSINLTAALIDPAGTVTGEVNATGCNIGVYYDSHAAHGSAVNGANVHGANYFGIVNNGASINVTNSNVHDIGETPLNGDQHGVAIYFAFGSTASGTIAGNEIWNYQKGGIVVNGATASAAISGNTVIGEGPVNYIAQNGIEVGYGAKATVTNNVVFGNSYTGPNFASSGGILVFGGPCYGPPNNTTNNVQVNSNTAVGNDVAVWFSNVAADCIHAVSTQTGDTASGNILRDNAVTNTTGFDGSTPYQAGVSDQGDGDSIVQNVICGAGYAHNPPHINAIDVSSTHNPIVLFNTVCAASGSSGSNAADINAAALAANPVQLLTVPKVFR